MKPVQPRNFGTEASDAVAARRPHLFDADYQERTATPATAAEVSQLRSTVTRLSQAIAALTSRVRALEERGSQ